MGLEPNRSFVPFNPKLVQSKDEINPNPSKVGEKVYEFMSKPQEQMEVGEIIDAYKDKYTQEMHDVLLKGSRIFDPPFYVVVLHKKEPWAVNVLRNWFVSRQTKPLPTTLRNDYPNHSHTVYSFDQRSCELKICWNLPTSQDANTILKNKQLYDSQLVDWIVKFNNGTLS